MRPNKKMKKNEWMDEWVKKKKMQQEKGETFPSFSAEEEEEEEEEAGSSRPTAESTKEDKLNENAKHSTGKTRKLAYTSGYIPGSLMISQEMNQKSPTPDVKCYDPCLHTDHLPGSANMFPSTSEAPQYPLFGQVLEDISRPHPINVSIPVVASSSRPYIQVPQPQHLPSRGLILQSGWEVLDKDKQTTVEEKFSDGDVDEKLSDQNTFSSPSSISSLIRRHGSHGGQNKNWTDPDLPHSSLIHLPPQESIGKTVKGKRSKAARLSLLKKMRQNHPYTGHHRKREKVGDCQEYPHPLNTNIQGSRRDPIHALSDADKNILQKLQSPAVPSFPRPLVHFECRPRKESSQKSPSLDVKHYDLSPHTDHLPGSVNMFSGTSVVPRYPLSGKVSPEDISRPHPINVSIPVVASSSKPPIHIPPPVHFLTRPVYTGHALSTGYKELDKDKLTTVEEKFSGGAGGAVDAWMSDQNAFSSPSSISSLIRCHESHGGQNKNWTDPYLSHSSSTFSPPDKRIRSQSLGEIFHPQRQLMYPKEFNTSLKEKCPTEPESIDATPPHPVWPESSLFDPWNEDLREGDFSHNSNRDLLSVFKVPLSGSEIILGDTDDPHAQSQKRSDYDLQGSSGAALPSTSLEAGFQFDSSPAEKKHSEHSLRQQTEGEPRPAGHSLPADSHPLILMSPQTPYFSYLSDRIHSTPSFLSISPSSCDRGFSSNFRPSDHSTVPEGSRAAELSSVHSDTESGGGVDAVSCSVTNTLQTQIQTSSSGPSWTTGFSGSVSRSHSSPSLSHMTSAERKTLTRAQSLPDLQLNSSCEQFTPDITADEEDETYRFQCSSPGLYQCSVTGLVFHMEREGDVVYRTVPWNRKLLSQHHKQPAGPLFDIKCEQQSVCQLHLPHCEIRSTGGADFLSVAHLDGESIEFISPHKITETHVIINITGFSAFGNVKDEDSPPDPIRALVLLFYKPPADPDPTSLLNVLLLPRNVSIPDVVRYRKKLIGDEHYIEKPSDCKLHPEQEYTLSVSPEDDLVLVEPPTAEFDSDHYNNYLPSFQVTLEKPMTHLRLFLRDTKSSHSVWERRVCLSSSGVQRSCGQSLNLPPNQRLFETRSSFIEGVSGPVLKSLLDKLLEKTVMTDSEVESAGQIGDRGDKARFVIDTVRRKGEAASSEMIEALCDLDPFFSEHLGLM